MQFPYGARKLKSFDIYESYSPKTLEKLNSITGELNEHKKKLSDYIRWYLNEREKLGVPKPDTERLCRALAFPDFLADKVIRGTGSYTPEQLSGEEGLLQFYKNMYDFAFLKFASKDFINSLKPEQIKALQTDVNELGVYAGIYLKIEAAGSVYNPLNLSYFPNGNPFDSMMDIMKLGSLIVRFKYVSRDGSEPVEKVVSYHTMKSVVGHELAVHIEGDKKFSMYKTWGYGDEKLTPLERRYENIIIRWGKNDARRARDGVEDKRDTFLY